MVSHGKHLEKSRTGIRMSDELVLGDTARFVHFCNACCTVYVSDHRKSRPVSSLVRAKSTTLRRSEFKMGKLARNYSSGYNI